MSVVIDDLEIVLNTGHKRPDREAALKRLMEDSWKRGWDDATREAVALTKRVGAVATKPMLGWDPSAQ